MTVNTLIHCLKCPVILVNSWGRPSTWLGWELKTITIHKYPKQRGRIQENATMINNLREPSFLLSGVERQYWCDAMIMKWKSDEWWIDEDELIKNTNWYTPLLGQGQKGKLQMHGNKQEKIMNMKNGKGNQLININSTRFYGELESEMMTLRRKWDKLRLHEGSGKGKQATRRELKSARVMDTYIMKRKLL